MPARPLALTLAALLVLACGGPAAAPSPSPTAAPSTTAPATPVPTPEAGALTFQVQAGSKAVVRVREQLAGVSAPGDAVLESGDVKGSFGLRADGTFTAVSKITVGLDALTSDSNIRDGFIKGTTLEVRRFPTADFVPVRATGLPAPLPAAGEWTFQLTGRITVHGVEKEVTWEVKATRAAAGITASAKNSPTWKFGDFDMRVPRAASVLSVVDEIRVELELTAK